MYLVPRLPEFFARYPDLAVDLDVSERHVNLIEEGVDVAIRIGFLADFHTNRAPDWQHGGCHRSVPQIPRCARRAHDAGHLEHNAAVVFMSRGAPRAWQFKGPSARS